MPFTIAQIRESQAGPRSSVYPDSTYGIVNVTNQPAQTGAYIPKVLNVAIVSTQWNLSPRSILSYSIRASIATGGQFRIEVSPDGTNYQFYLIHHLIGLVYTSGSGIELPGFACRFSVFNDDVALAQSFTGSIILKGV